MARSLRSEPREIRAARRARPPRVTARRPAAGRSHPAGVGDIRFALDRFGPAAYYGVRLIELVPARTADDGVIFGRLVGPGHIELYDQLPSPWRLGRELTDRERARLAAAGADVSTPGVVAWPERTLRAFMLGHVLAHELGHHALQHERRMRGQRGARTSEHEARAELVAARLRARLPWP
jgi:hypothetical protein